MLRVAAMLRNGRFDAALQLSRQTRAALDADADPNQALAVGGLLMHEALVHLERGELELAAPLLERADELVRSNEGFSVFTQAHRAHLLRRQGRLDEAERCAKRALRFAENSDSAELAGGGLARVELAWIALERGDPQVALDEVEAGL